MKKRIATYIAAGLIALVPGTVNSEESTKVEYSEKTQSICLQSYGLLIGRTRFMNEICDKPDYDKDWCDSYAKFLKESTTQYTEACEDVLRLHLILKKND